MIIIIIIILVIIIIILIVILTMLRISIIKQAVKITYYFNILNNLFKCVTNIYFLRSKIYLYIFNFIIVKYQSIKFE